MKILHRYLLAEVIPPYLVSLFAFSFVVVFQQFTKLADLVLAKGVPPLLVARLLLALFPAFLEVALPAALLLAVLLALGRMGADSETTAMRAAGVGMRGALPPIGILCLVTFLASLLVGSKGIPWGYGETRAVLAEVLALRAGAAAQEHAFREIAPGVILFPDRVSPDGTKMSGVFLSHAVAGSDGILIFARGGAFAAGNSAGGTPRLVLAQGELHDDSAGGGSYRHAAFQSLELHLPPPAASDGNGGTLKGLSYAGLLERAKKARGTQEETSALFHFHRRLALSVSCLAFGLLAVPIGFAQRARRKSPAFAITVALVLFFYLFRAAAGALELAAPRLSLVLLWAPDALGIAAAAWLVRSDGQAALLRPGAGRRGT